MGKKGTSLFQKETNSLEFYRNIVELDVLESRRHLRQKVNELIQLAINSSASTEEIQRQLSLDLTRFGTQLSSQLLRLLNRDDPQERQSIVWLLIILNDAQTITPLRHISLDKRIPRSIRLSASLALAGMGATVETNDNCRRTRLYAIVNAEFDTNRHSSTRLNGYEVLQEDLQSTPPSSRTLQV